MLEAIIKRLKHDKHGVSNVIVVMLSLVLIVVIVANVVLWSYQMNQFDWERMQENLEIVDVARVTSSSWFVAQSEYSVNIGSRISGTYTDTQAVDDQYETFTEASPSQDWLTGWDKRVKITINCTDIGEALTDFPVLVYLSSSSGENNDDVTSVFDEVGSDCNATAYTTSDGTTRLYFEVEYWNATSEKAWVWVKVPSVSNTVDTDIYIYYDSAKDGSAYNSPTNVWDSNFLGVWHMQTDASDSSSPQYNGTATGSPSDVTGKIGGAQNFNAGIPDRYDTGTIPHGIGTGNFMMEAWVNRDVDTGQPYQGILANDDYAPAMYVETGGFSVWGGYWGGAMAADHETTTGVWYYYVMKREGSTIYFYRNGVVEASSYTRSTSMSNAIFRFGASSAAAVNHMDGAIDEARFSNTSRSAAWIKTGYETGRDDLLDFGSEETAPTEWLNGWDKRVKITVNSSDIDISLAGFPVLIFLSNSSAGENDEDVSFVFDELTSDVNRKKIAVTTSDGTTECYVEIEKWDDANEQAWLWVKVPSISNTTDTDLYLYYDADHADNTDYVGDPQSTPAQNVWSPKYSAIFHFNSNFNDSADGDTPSNTPGATFVAGKIANAGEFYDNGDEADYTTADALGGSGATDDDVGTVSFWMKGNEASYDYIVDVGYTSGFIPANYDGTGNPYLETYWGGWRSGGTGVVTLNEWHHVVVRWNAGIGFNMWVDGASYNSYSGARSIVVDKVTIGNHKNHGAFEANAIIDEVRFVDDVLVSDAWIKASYETGRDHLLDFGSEESLERNELDIVGVFAIDLSTYPLTYIQTVEIQLKYRARDIGENWFPKSYNWSSSTYSDNGFNSTAGHMPTMGWDYYAVNLTDQWNSYVQNNGTVYVKIIDEEGDSTQTTIDIDFLAVRVVIDGTKFTLQNKGSLTSHLVSLWINNSTEHRRYDINVFINSGDTVAYTRSDISLPDKQNMVNVVTERGNIAVFASD